MTENEAFLAPRPQIAPGQAAHSNGAKRLGFELALAHGFNHSSISIRFGLISSHVRCGFRGPRWINRHEASRARAPAGLTSFARSVAAPP